MTSKFGLFKKNKINALYLTENILTEWLQKLDEYWDEEDKPYSEYFGFWYE